MCLRLSTIHPFLTLLLVILPQQMVATHLVGGELTYVYQGANASGQNEFEVHCYIYRDCSSANTNQTGFDDTAVIGVYQGSDLITTVSGNLDFSLVTNVIPQNPNNCAFLPEDLCIERAEYIVNIELEPSQQPYSLVHQRCCRSPAITNLELPQDQGFSLTTTIPPSLTMSNPNSSPIFLELPQAFVCNNYPFQLDNGALDIDGDSLSYSLCSIYLGGNYLSPIPNPPTGPPFTEVGWADGFNAGNPLGALAALNINPSTGQLTGTPNIPGKFALGICVTEWRNGLPIGSILRDFTLDVVTCNIQSPGYFVPEPCTGMTVQFDQFSNPSEAYTWDFGVYGTIDDVSYEAEPTFTYEDPGTYNVSLYFETGTCADSMFFEVVAHEPWDAQFNVINLMCDNGGWTGAVVIDTSQWTSYIDYNWDFGANSMPPGLTDEHPDEIWFPPGKSINISLESNAFGCQNNATSTFELPELPEANFEVISEPCSGLEVAFENLSPDSGPFSWDFGGGNGLSNSDISPIITYSEYGTYGVTLTAGAGTECSDVMMLEVTVLPVLPFDTVWTIQPISICEETGFTLLQFLGNGADEVTWDFPGILNSNEAIVEAYFPGIGEYEGSITLYNAYCDIEMTWSVVAEVPSPLVGIDYMVPNVISANNDAKNDDLTVAFLSPNGEPISGLNLNQFVDYRLRVFNRWGNEIFSTKQAGSAWRPGPEVSAGTYYILFEAQHVCDTEPFQHAGPVTVIR
ncbi:MAG TPA: hypothetical protein DD635_08985 [Flavobacteriales bacterium]|nr:hypothetical protein [Flavobacteriales bacterium]